MHHSATVSDSVVDAIDGYFESMRCTYRTCMYSYVDSRADTYKKNSASTIQHQWDKQQKYA